MTCFSVKDKLPTHNYTVLGVVIDYPPLKREGIDDRFWDTVTYFPKRGCWILNGYDEQPDGGIVTVTHWMELPKLPTL